MVTSLLLTMREIWKIYIVKLIRWEHFGKLVRQMKNLSRYIPNIHPETRQNQIGGTIPRKAFASVTYSDKKILEFVRELTSNIYSNYSSMELVLKFNLQKKQPKLHKWMEI